jgi:hypothetical protein
MKRKAYLKSRTRKIVVGVGGLLVLGGAVFLVECGGLDDSNATAAGGQRKALATTTPSFSESDESCAAPIAVPPLPTLADPSISCHPSACTPNFCNRGDIAGINNVVIAGNADSPRLQPLLQRLLTLDCSPHSIPPLQVFAEADPTKNGKSLLFQYYLLDSTGFQLSPFTGKVTGINDDDSTQRTVWGANCNLATVGSVRLALEPKPGLPTNPDNPRAFIDIFTDIRGLFVINNESGWYEGWMIHDLLVAPTDKNAKGRERPRFGFITEEDAERLKHMGHGNNVFGNFFTVDGEKPHTPSTEDSFPDKVTNVVPLQLSMGAYNSLQQSDTHNYWEFNYQTNWIHPLYELPFAGGFPDKSPTQPADTFQDGEIGALQSIVPGNSPGENRNRARAVAFGDNPNNPRDPDKFDSDVETQREFRERFVPSGIANEAFLNAFERLASFEPEEHNLERRLLDGYRAAVATVDTNHDGIVSAAEGDIDTENQNCPPDPDNPDNPGVRDNACIFLLPRSFNRFAVTREINDGLLAPRFAPSTRGWVLSGRINTGFASFGASEGEDSDDR